MKYFVLTKNLGDPHWSLLRICDSQQEASDYASPLLGPMTPQFSILEVAATVVATLNYP